MNENDPLGAEIEVLVQDGKPIVLLNKTRLPLVNGKVFITMDDMINKSIVGFNRMHKKIEMLLESSPGPKKVDYRKLISLIANSTLTRVSHIEQFVGVPRFMAKKIFEEFVTSNACVMSGGALKKTKEYYSVIKDYDIRLKERSRADDFIIPSEYDAVPGQLTPPLCDWNIGDLQKLLENAKAHGVKASELGGIVRQIQFKIDEEKEKKEERIVEIMKTKKIDRHDAENEWEDEFLDAQNKTEGGDIKGSEWDTDGMDSEREEEEDDSKERTQRKKKKAITKKKKK